MAHRYPYISSIVNTLDSVTRLGSFASGGPLLLPLPVLKFNKVESIARLPVSERKAKEIKAVCSQAPYGLGQETIVDTTVRNTWQLDPSQFTIMNPQWDSHMEKLAAVVKDELGCDPALNVRCELYKFLLYEQGSFFKPHRDTEKVDGMFGTLVLQLPSDYEGGLLRVCHSGEEQIFDFSGLNGISGFHYAAFYADCQHELCKVTKGYRLCFVYNLVYSGDSCTCPVYSQVSDKVVARLRDWEQDDHGLPVMAYMLSHQYCEASLSFQLLKGADRAVAEILVEASNQKSFCLYLGTVTLKKELYPYGGEDCEYLDAGVSNSLTANSLVSPSGETLTSISLFCDDLVPYDVFKNVKPDKENFIGTGNEGVALEKMYHQAALVIWPMKHYVIVMGVSASISKLESACKKLTSLGCESEAAQQQRECEELAKEIVAGCREPKIGRKEFCIGRKDEVITMLSCLQQLNAATLACQFLEYVVYLCKGSGVVIEVCDWFGTSFGWEHLEQPLVVLFESEVARNVEQACIFFFALTGTSSISSQQLKVCQKLVDIICRAIYLNLPCSKQVDRDSCFWLYSVSGSIFVQKLFKAFCVLQCEDQLEVVLQSFFKQPKCYPLCTTLVPAAIKLHKCIAADSRPLYLLVSHCVATLEQLTQEEPDEKQLSKAKMQDRQNKLNLLARIRPLLEEVQPPKRLKTTENSDDLNM